MVKIPPIKMMMTWGWFTVWYCFPHIISIDLSHCIPKKICLPTFFYPLVNIQKAMDNHHFSWENPLFRLGHFQLLFVGSPEGKPPFSCGFPMVFLWFSYGSYGLGLHHSALSQGTCLLGQRVGRLAALAAAAGGRHHDDDAKAKNHGGTPIAGWSFMDVGQNGRPRGPQMLV